MSDPNKLVFPELLVPATNKVLLPSTKKLNKPAAKELIILFLMNKGSVHGSSLCLLKAYANPLGDKGSFIAATLDLIPPTTNSVSKIGFASSKGLPDCNLNFAAQDSASS